MAKKNQRFHGVEGPMEVQEPTAMNRPTEEKAIVLCHTQNSCRHYLQLFVSVYHYKLQVHILISVENAEVVFSTYTCFSSS